MTLFFRLHLKDFDQVPSRPVMSGHVRSRLVTLVTSVHVRSCPSRPVMSCHIRHVWSLLKPFVRWYKPTGHIWEDALMDLISYHLK